MRGSVGTQTRSTPSMKKKNELGIQVDCDQKDLTVQVQPDYYLI